jgi:hypothetical protein
MLAYVLAIAVALGSFVFYIAAFFFPEVHRKNDFYWCFLGLFYALVLWVASNRLTGSVLLAQTASVVLLGWMGWQTLTLRKTTSPAVEQTEVSPEVAQKASGFSLGNILGLFQRKKAEPAAPSVEPEAQPETETPKEAVPSSGEEAIQAIEDSEAIPAKPDVDIISSESPQAGSVQTVAEETEMTEQPISPEPPNPEMVEAAQAETEAGTVENVEEAVVEAAHPRIEDPNVDEDTPVEKVAPEAELTPPAETSPEQSPPIEGELSEFPDKVEPS